MPAPPAIPTVGAPNHTADHATISAILGGLQAAVNGLQGSSPAFLLAGKLFFATLAAFAEFERDLIRERTRDRLAAATARGRNGRRKHRLTEDQKVTARKLRADGHSIREIGQLLGNGTPVSRQTVYRALGMLAT